jgi:hypothetical protein
MPTIELNKPMELAITDCPLEPGKLCAMVVLWLRNSILSAERVAITPNRMLSQRPSTLVTRCRAVHRVK